MKDKCIAIGASAGGLAPISQIFEQIGDVKSNYFFMAQHFNPRSTSLLKQILARYASHQIEFINSKTELNKGVFYILPPGKKLCIEGKTLWTEDDQNNPGPTPSVDRYFETLATHFGKDLIGVVLSGSGSDGSIGANKIVEQGGNLLVQSSTEAKFTGMPESTSKKIPSAKALTCKNIIRALNSEDLEAEIEKIATESLGSQPDYLGLEHIKETNLKKLLKLLFETTEVDFGHYRQNSINRRLSKFLSDIKSPSIDHFLTAYSEDKITLNKLKNYLLIPVTSFFRDGDSFVILEELILKKIEQFNSGEVFRVWVPACSTGQEAYTLALILQKIRIEAQFDFDYKIFATDINRENINHARKGEFPLEDLTEIPHQFLESILAYDDYFTFDSKIRDRIIFSEQDLLRNSPFHKMHLVSCRNFLIYLNLNAQSIVYQKLFHSLRDDGLLFLGRSENLRENDQFFFTINAKFRIFAKNGNLDVRIDRFFSSNPKGVENFKINLDKDFSLRKKTSGPSHIQLVKDEIKHRFMPPHIICGKDWDVIEFIGNVDRFLTFGEGPRQSKLLYLLRREYHSEFVTLNSRLEGKERSVRSQFPIRLSGDESKYELELELAILEQKGLQDEIRTIIFHLNPVKETTAIESDPQNSQDSTGDERYYSMQLELDNTKKQLARIIEEAEGANEELQSMNEELQASNEELQSTNEELESTNEELLASNEELKNVNNALESKNTEISLLNQEVKSVFDHLSSMIIILDQNLNIVRTNKAAQLNFPILSESQGRSIVSLNLPKEFLALEPSFRRAIEEGSLTNQELNIENEYYFLKCSSFKHANKPHLIVSMLVITEIMSVKKRLEKNELLTKSYFDNTHSLIEIKELDGRYIFVNQRYLNVFGLRTSEVIGKSIDEIFPKKICDEINLLENDVIRTLTRKNTTMKLPTKDGPRYYLIGKFPIQYQRSSKISAIGSISVDVTEMIELTKELQHTQKSATRSSKLAALGELFASLGHELNNPINAILVQSRSLGKFIEIDKLDEKKMKTGVERIERLSLRAASIVNSIKMFGRESTDDNKVVIPFSRVWEDVQAIIEHRLVESQIELVQKVPMNSTLFCRPGDIGLVLVNLINNAIDAILEESTNGEKKIVLKAQASNEIFKLTVQDSGKGVSETIKSRLFEPFETTKELGHGSGLGLSLCYGIMMAHGGRIFLDNQTQRTTFVIELPQR